MKQQKVSIGEAAKLLGVSDQTLRNWEKKGLIDVERTPSGHRRYSLNQLLQQRENNKQDENIVIYARVSTKKQADAGNLERQKNRLVEYAIHHQYRIIGIFDDIASGLNENRKGLSNLLKMIKDNDVSYLLIEYKDRLARFGFRYLENHLRELGCQMIILDKKEVNEEQELVEDLIAITTSFSARIYGKRGGKQIPREIEKTLKRGGKHEDESNHEVTTK